MAKDSSFDIVSQVDMQEMSNAVNQTEKEISQRYDFRGSIASIELEDKAIKIAAEDDYKLNAIIDILRARMAKRGLSLRSLELGKIEDAAKVLFVKCSLLNRVFLKKMQRKLSLR